MSGSTDCRRPAVYSGSLDLLAPDTLRLRERGVSEGADITFVLRQGHLHIWPTTFVFLVPEALAVRPDIYRQLGIGSEALTGPAWKLRLLRVD